MVSHWCLDLGASVRSDGVLFRVWALNYDGPHCRWVRRLAIDNACYWLHEYHIDTTAIGYHDLVRCPTCAATRQKRGFR